MSDYLGIYQGSVVDNNDVLGIGRVTCLVPQVQADQATTWCHPIYPTVYKPNVGDIVWVQFINGDLTKPIYFSSDAVTAEKIVAKSIEFENLSGDAVSSIITQSLAATEVTIGDQTNRVGDPFFTGTNPFVIESGSGSFLTSSSVNVPPGSPKTTLVKPSTTSSVLEVQNNDTASLHAFEVTGGEIYREFISGACTDSSTNLALGLMVYDQNMENPTWVPGDLVVNGVTSSQPFATAASANMWLNYTFQVTIPSNVTGGNIASYAVPGWKVDALNWYLTNWQVLKANAGLLLVDGSIIANGLIQGGKITGSTFDAPAGSDPSADPATVGGVEINGQGLKAWSPTQVNTLAVDATTGDVTVMGEFGTSPPDASGVHISSNTFAGVFGNSTYPTIQFSNGGQGIPGNRQPMIFTDTTGSSNLYMWGGAGTTSRLAQVKLDAGMARIGIENTIGDNDISGDRIEIINGGLYLFSSQAVEVVNIDSTAFQDLTVNNLNTTGNVATTGTGTISSAGNMSTAGTFTATKSISTNTTLSCGGNLSVGANANVTGAVQCDGSFQTGASAFQATNIDGTSFKPINASAFNVSSDRSLKQQIKAPSIDALSAIRSMPVYEYTLHGEEVSTIGVMADDAPDILTVSTTLNDDEGNKTDAKTLNLYALLATLVQAVQDLDAQLDEVLPDRKKNKPARKSRTLDKG